jgi:hypothetical protein
MPFLRAIRAVLRRVRVGLRYRVVPLRMLLSAFDAEAGREALVIGVSINGG